MKRVCILCGDELSFYGEFGLCWRCRLKWLGPIREWRRLSEEEQEAKLIELLDEANKVEAVRNVVRNRMEVRVAAFRREIRKLGLDPDGKICLYCGKFEERSYLCAGCSRKWFEDPGRMQSMSQEESDGIWAKVFEAIRIKKANESRSLLDYYFGGENPTSSSPTY